MYRLTVDIIDVPGKGIGISAKVSIDEAGATEYEAFLAHTALILVAALRGAKDIPEVEALMRSVGKNTVFDENGIPDVDATMRNMMPSQNGATTLARVKSKGRDGRLFAE